MARDIMQIVHLIHVLDGTAAGDWSRKQRLDHLKMARENKYITPDEAIDLAVHYTTKWKTDDFLKEQGVNPKK